jgi:DNA invertase Pin-like site-specific DNA recombinase
MTTQVKSEASEPVRAAQYLRMSTEHQRYSIVNQSAAIALYAAAHEIVIVRSYLDAGKSGLCIKGRYALQDLIQTVRSGAADFQCILVYDVSRWGRFQDLDEAAHYEYICKNAGIHIRYCTEQFENDKSMLSGLLKALKRMMAAEYSRELSVRIFAAQRRLAGMGLSQGGRPIYGLSRLLVDSDFKPKKILEYAEHKAIRSDRVVFVAGPPEEVEIVHRIFDLCTIHRMTPPEIALELNADLVRTQLGKPWLPGDVRRLIKNPKYVGTFTYGKTSKKLLGPRTATLPADWVIKKHAFAATVSAEQFAAAQSRLLLQRNRYTDEQMLDKLRRVWRREGSLSVNLVNRSGSGPGSTLYASRFGHLDTAFKMVGFTRNLYYSKILELKAQKRKVEGTFRLAVIEQLRNAGVQVAENSQTAVLTLNGDLGLAIKVIHYKRCDWKWLRVGWPFGINFSPGVEVLILACLDCSNQKIQSQFIFPRLSQLQGSYWLNEGKNRAYLEACRSDTLRPLLTALSRRSLDRFETQ